jgi:tetratricopeptide (TPR) repeat protein
MAGHLQDALREDPCRAEAHLSLAAQYLQLFDAAQKASENPMALSQIRDAALISEFPDPSQRQRWFSLVMGPRRRFLDAALYHARTGLRLSPLQGEGYVYLAELAFLDGGDALSKRACVEQALRVRPHDGAVLLAAGSERALSGDAEGALELWQQAFRCDPAQQARLIDMLASRMPAEQFVARFQPGRGGLQKLFDHYRRQQLPVDAKFVAPRLLRAIEEAAPQEPEQVAANSWELARRIQRFLGDTAGAVEAARRAVDLLPDDFTRRRRLALALSENGDYEKAVRQLQWCLRRKPNDETLQQKLLVAARMRRSGPGVTRH